MRIIQKLLPAIFAAATISQTAWAGIVPQQIVVKLKSGAELFDWQKHNRGGEIPALRTALGKHTTEGYIANNFFKKSKSSENILLANSKTSTLDRIVRIKYEEKIDPAVLSQKISALPFIEYAEPVFERSIVGAVNDSLAGEQYYLEMVNALEAQDLINSQDTIIVGIVDTGIYYEHKDLHENIAYNPGETGLDANGNPKESNGIDDDDNGFVDDFRGWDLVGIYRDDPQDDNDARPGHPHGTHVGGTVGAMTNNKIGIAGVAKNVKLLPVKIGEDYSGSTGTFRGYEGILYANMLGARVINCSWGQAGFSQAEQEVITQVTENGSLVIAAAGNDASNREFYPANYAGVLSVAAVDKNYNEAYFTNFGGWVDISAPGVSIMATKPYDDYGLMSGTSMASPVTSGVAALAMLAHPEMSGQQIKELLKYTADRKLFDLNPQLEGKMGTGVVDALAAITADKVYAAEISEYSINNVSGNEESVDVGTKFQGKFTLQNIMDEIPNLKIQVVPADDETANYVSMTSDIITIGKFEKNAEVTLDDAFEFEISSALPYDKKLEFQVRLLNDDQILRIESTSITLRKSYIDFSNNDIALTVNSCGNLAFNDYPSNTQGIGFRYKNCDKTMLFEGATMLYNADGERLYDVARLESSLKGRAFKIRNGVKELSNETTWKNAKSQFDDSLDYSFSVEQNIYASSDADLRNIIVIEFYVQNKSDVDIENMYAGIYFDWDIGSAVRENLCNYFSEKDFSYCYSPVDDSAPYVGMKTISPYSVAYYGIDNAEEEGIGVYDGFFDDEKKMTLSSGIVNSVNTATDISQVMGAGPFALASGESKKIAIAIFVGSDLDELAASADIAKDYEILLQRSSAEEIFGANSGAIAFPNPASSELKVAFDCPKSGIYSCQVYDINGNVAKQVFENRNFESGKTEFEINTSALSAGSYYLRIMSAENSTIERKFIINR